MQIFGLEIQCVHSFVTMYIICGYCPSVVGILWVLSTLIVTSMHTLAAANAVDTVLAASKPKSKLLTPKQRLGKILGLNKGSRRKI